MVEKMEEKLEAAFGDQKRIFLIIFQRFIMILSEHLVKCDTDGRDYNTDWYRWTIGRLQQVFLVVSCWGSGGLFINDVILYGRGGELVKHWKRVFSPEKTVQVLKKGRLKGQ